MPSTRHVYVLASCIASPTNNAQSAAGTLSYISSQVLPNLLESLSGSLIPSELTPPSVRALENLMLAQAQECAWQRAVLGKSIHHYICCC